MLFGPLLQFPESITEESHRDIVKRTLEVIELLSDIVKEENTLRKRVVAEFIGSIVPRMTEYIGLFSKDPGIHSFYGELYNYSILELLAALLSSHLSFFTSLKSQIGMDGISGASSTYFSVLSSIPWMESVKSSAKSAIAINR